MNTTEQEQNQRYVRNKVVCNRFVVFSKKKSSMYRPLYLENAPRS